MFKQAEFDGLSCRLSHVNLHYYYFLIMPTLKYGTLNLTLSDNIFCLQILLRSFYSSTSVLSAEHAPVIACGRKLQEDVDRAREI